MAVIFQMVIKCNNIFYFKALTKIRIFGLKTNHLATLGQAWKSSRYFLTGRFTGIPGTLKLKRTQLHFFVTLPSERKHFMRYVHRQCCQMVYFHTKKVPILVGFEMKNVIWNVSRSFSTLNFHLVNFVVIWYIFTRIGLFNQINLATL
jgi:hypothetical protein